MTRSALTAGLLCLATPLVGAAPAHAQTSNATTFVAMDEISVPIIDASRIDGVLRISITLQAQDTQAAAKLAKRMPELRAAGLSVAIEFARLHASPFTPV